MTRFLLVLLVATTVSAQKVQFDITAPASLEAGQPAPWRVVIRNVSGADLPATTLSIQLYPATIQSLPAELACQREDASTVVRCTLPPLPRDAELAVDLTAVPPFRYGRVSANAAVLYGPTELADHDSKLAVYWRDFPVTSIRDAGPGSLRQTILDINATRECGNILPEWPSPCRAAFRITDPVPAEGWYTVRPSAPLPPMTAYDMSIDGSTQTAPNSLGPAVAIDGSSLVFGNGLVCEGACEIRGLSIGGFPWNGIHGVSRMRFVVEDSYIGVDPTGQRARPNGSRGIAVEVVQGTISRNVISGNGRSGLFFTGNPSASFGPNIRDNRIGVAAHDDTPIGNGASGIFIGEFYGAYSHPVIEGNVIANNRHFGIALTPKSPMIILGNVIHDNGAGGIDIGLDGPTDSVPGVPGVEGGVVAPPVILSAVYADGVTTIKGFVKRSGVNDRRQVLLYANSTVDRDGFAEGEQFLGITPATFREDTSFTFIYPGDLRGKYVNGTVAAVTQWGWDEYSYTPSEFGRAIAVAE